MKKKTVHFLLKWGFAVALVVGLSATILCILGQYPDIAKFVLLVGVMVGFIMYCRYVLADEIPENTYPLMEVTVCTGGRSRRLDGQYIEKSYVTVGNAGNNDIVLHDTELFGDVRFCIEKKEEYYYIKALNLTNQMYKVKKSSPSIVRDSVQLYSDAKQNCFRIFGKNKDDYMDIQIILH